MKMSLDSHEAMLAAIREIGFIPFFQCPVPGFSIQEMTPPEHWFDSSDDLGPWDWKVDVVQSGEIAYGKFLCGGKAGFATVEWYAHIMNWRRSLPKYRPDAGSHPKGGKSSAKALPAKAESKVLAAMEAQGSISSKDIRQLLGVKKAAADALVARLAQMARLLAGDIQRVYRGPELKYSGWQTCSYCSPEALFGADLESVRGAANPSGGRLFGGFSPFSEPAAAANPLDPGCSPEESRKKLAGRIREFFPSATDKAISKILD